MKYALTVSIHFCSLLQYLRVIVQQDIYTIELSESDLIRYNYHSNVDYIKMRTGDLERDIILTAIKKYRKQLELKKNIDKKFKDFETLYNHFNTLDMEQKWFLLDQLPYTYHEKLLKKLTREQ